MEKGNTKNGKQAAGLWQHASALSFGLAAMIGSGLIANANGARACVSIAVSLLCGSITAYSAWSLSREDWDLILRHLDRRH